MVWRKSMELLSIDWAIPARLHNLVLIAPSNRCLVVLLLLRRSMVDKHALSVVFGRPILKHSPLKRRIISLDWQLNVGPMIFYPVFHINIRWRQFMLSRRYPSCYQQFVSPDLLNIVPMQISSCLPMAVLKVKTFQMEVNSCIVRGFIGR